MKKRLLSLALALVMALALLPAAALAADTAIVEAIPCQYDAAYNFSEGFAAVRTGDNWDFIDKTGEKIINHSRFGYEEARRFSDGFAAVRDKRAWYFVDTAGDAFDFYFEDVLDFSEGLAAVKRDGKWGYIDPTYELPFRIDNKYEAVHNFSEGLAAVKRDGKWGYIDVNGKEVVPCQYDQTQDFSEGFAAVVLGGEWYEFPMNGELVMSGYGGEWGYIDKNGKEVIPCQYESAHSFSEGLAAVGTFGLWSFIDKTGEEVIFSPYLEVHNFSGGLAAVQAYTGYWGFTDKAGQEIIPCEYDEVHSFSEGLAAVKKDGKWGYIDANGSEVVPFQYDQVQNFSEGFAAVGQGGNWDFLEIESLDEYGQGGKWGYVDKTGREVVPCKYDDAQDFSEGLAAVKLDDKWGFLAVSDAPASNPKSQTGDSPSSIQPQPEGAPALAYASTQSVLVDGSPVEFQAYALKDANGNDTNYIKLRDVASVLNGTAVQFNVGWDGAVNIETGKAYTPNGSEMSTPFSGNRSYEEATAETRIDGVAANLSTIVLKDDAGGAYTYYKLRDLGEALGFRVDWSAEKGIFIETK